MANESEQTLPKAVNTFKQRGWPDVVSHLGALIITKNLLLPAGALALLLLCTWKLNSGDLRALLEMVINRKWFAVTGWLLFTCSVFVSIKVVKWQGKICQDRIDDLKKVSDTSTQEQLKLEPERPQITNTQK
jgi:hypothetical protein